MCTPRESELMCNSRNFPPVVAHCMTSQDFSAGCTREFCKSGQLQHAHTYTHTHTHTQTNTQTNTHIMSYTAALLLARRGTAGCSVSVLYRVQSLWPLTFHAWACGLFCTCQCCASIHESLEFTQGCEWISLLVVFGNTNVSILHIQ